MTQNIFLEMKRIEDAKAALIKTMREKRLNVPDNASISDLPGILETLSGGGFADILDETAKGSDNLAKQRAIQEADIFDYFDSMKGVRAVVDDDTMWTQVTTTAPVKNAMLDNSVTLAVLLASPKRVDEVAAWTVTDTRWIGVYTKNRSLMETLVKSFPALSRIVDSKTAMDAVAASDVALSVIVGSAEDKTRQQFATASLFTDGTATKMLCENPQPLTQMVLSQTSMTSLAASSTAMQAIVASSTAMQAIVASSTAMQAIAASSTAMQAIAANEVAMKEMTESKFVTILKESSATNGRYILLGTKREKNVFDNSTPTGAKEKGYRGTYSCKYGELYNLLATNGNTVYTMLDLWGSGDNYAVYALDLNKLK